MVAVPSIVTHWASFYNDRTSVSAGITYLHIAGMLLGGGFAVVADREALRVSPAATPPERWADVVDQLPGVHRWVLVGLSVMFATGFLMMLADLDTYFTSAVFWTKMGLVALLLANGYGRVRAERLLRRGDATGWAQFRRTSIASVVLWFAVLLASTILTTV
jgi:Family of unknown function (DUF6644)